LRLTTSNFGTGFIVLVVTVIVFAIFPTLVTTPVLISGIVCSWLCDRYSTTVDPTFTD
jgi:hypothetical protein